MNTQKEFRLQVARQQIKFLFIVVLSDLVL